MGSRALAAAWQQWGKTAVMAGSMAGAGDIVCQSSLQNQRPNQQSSDGSNHVKLDLKRTFSFVVFGIVYGGLFQRVVYQQFDAWFGVASTTRVVVQKTCAELFFHGPVIYIPSFYVTTGLIQGKTIKDSVSLLLANYEQTLRGYYVIWPVAILALFYKVPEGGRIAFLSGCSFVEKTTFSWVLGSSK